ncbi:DUF7521 family protein [Haloarcula marina]|uniref:DUF7521 family protein n=1 Tax=Haloarcula marina TaxID=2961574 RepID=UPI0020B6B1A6|nr:hypothetical protein [Halomicroarcula marina]
MTSLFGALFSPETVAWGSRALTAAVGLFVAALAYRGFRRNDAPKMRALAVGIGLLTTGAFLATGFTAALAAGEGVVLLARGVVTVAGLCAVLYALLRE